MKKLIVAILAVFYLSMSAGATIHMHFCMGKLVEWGLSHNDSRKCGECGMEKSDEKESGCCRDESTTIKLDLDQKRVEAAIQLVQISSEVLSVAYSDHKVELFSSLSESYPVSNAPPRSNQLPTYLFNCVFRI